MPGISVSRIPIPFKGKGGVNWSSYWTTRTPSALALTPLSDTSIKLDWTANGVEDYDGYSVERSTDGITYAEVDTVTVGIETFTDTGLTAGTKYYYRARAYKDINFSSYTNISTKTISAKFDNGKVVFSFDDGVTSQYTDLYPYLVTKGVAATFYLLGDQLEAGTQLTYANAITMHNAGMDMQSHGKAHTQYTLLSESEILAEIAYMNNLFTSNGLPAPTQLSYPGGTYSYDVAEIIRDNGLLKTARSTAWTYSYFYQHTDSNKFTIPSSPIDNIDAAAIAAIKVLMDNAKTNKTAISLFGHGVGGTGVSLTTLGDLIDYAASIGIDVITMSQLSDLMDTEPINYRMSNFDVVTQGDGSELVTITAMFNTDCVLTLTGGAKFYSDISGTLNEATEWRIKGTEILKMYIKCASGTSSLSVPATKIRYWEVVNTTVNQPAIYCDISNFIECGQIIASHSLGDISKLLKAARISVDSSTNSGDISDNSVLKFLSLIGTPTVTGDITNKTGLIQLNVRGTNGLTGDLSGKTAMTFIYATGNNTLYGDLGGADAVVNGLTYCLLNPCRMVTYTSGATWTNATVTINPSAGYGYDSTEIDNILIDMAASPTLISKTITLQGANAVRTSASDAAVATLQGVGRTCTLVLNT